MRGLLVAIGFLTRIPVPARVFDDASARSQSLAWYPLVGVLIGTLLCALVWALPDAKPLLVAAIVLLAWVAITGALHLDGLADSADAWIGGNEVGLEAQQSLGPDRTLALLVEKDFKCLQPRPGEESYDGFPNPNTSC